MLPWRNGRTSRRPKIDQALALTAINDSIAQGGDQSEIDVAQALFAEGDQAKFEGGGAICDVALDKYEESWEKASQSWCNP